MPDVIKYAVFFLKAPLIVFFFQSDPCVNGHKIIQDKWHQHHHTIPWMCDFLTQPRDCSAVADAVAVGIITACLVIRIKILALVTSVSFITPPRMVGGVAGAVAGGICKAGLEIIYVVFSASMSTNE